MVGSQAAGGSRVQAAVVGSQDVERLIHTTEDLLLLAECMEGVYSLFLRTAVELNLMPSSMN